MEWLDATAPLEQIEAAAKGARLLAISFVQYLTGYRADLEGHRRDLPAATAFFFRGCDSGPGRVSL